MALLLLLMCMETTQHTHTHTQPSSLFPRFCYLKHWYIIECNQIKVWVPLENHHTSCMMNCGWEILDELNIRRPLRLHLILNYHAGSQIVDFRLIWPKQRSVTWVLTSLRKDFISCISPSYQPGFRHFYLTILKMLTIFRVLLDLYRMCCLKSMWMSLLRAFNSEAF